MIEVLEKVAKEFALAVFDIIEWALRKLTAPQG
jgi:hypothetical protein